MVRQEKNSYLTENQQYVLILAYISNRAQIEQGNWKSCRLQVKHIAKIDNSEHSRSDYKIHCYAVLRSKKDKLGGKKS
jgi:hypothetical protein